MIVGDDQDTHWVGDLHYKYTVDGCTYSASHYFRAFDERRRDEGSAGMEGTEIDHPLFPWQSRPLNLYRQ